MRLQSTGGCVGGGCQSSEPILIPESSFGEVQQDIALLAHTSHATTEEEFQFQIRNWFLAPTGAQEMLMSVRLSDESLSRALNLHLSPSGQSQVRHRSVSGQAQVIIRYL